VGGRGWPKVNFAFGNHTRLEILLFRGGGKLGRFGPVPKGGEQRSRSGMPAKARWRCGCSGELENRGSVSTSFSNRPEEFLPTTGTPEGCKPGSEDTCPVNGWRGGGWGQRIENLLMDARFTAGRSPEYLRKRSVAGGCRLRQGVRPILGPGPHQKALLEAIRFRPDGRVDGTRELPGHLGPQGGPPRA